MHSILQTLLSEFGGDTPSDASHSLAASATASESLAESLAAVDTGCARCGGHHYWQPRGTTDWYCAQCDPPPSESMIGDTRGAPKIISSAAYAVGQVRMCEGIVGVTRIMLQRFIPTPVCSCGSHMIVEHTWSDDHATYECGSNDPGCKLLLPAASHL